MAATLYSPIIKGKLNDVKALGHLTTKSRAITKPIIEAMPLAKDEDIGRHIKKLADYLIKHIPLGDIYLDFYGLLPGAKMADGADAVISGFRLVTALGRKVTPVYGFGRDDSIWPALKETVVAQGNGFCFRIDIDDLDDQAEDTWAQILERSAVLQQQPDHIDLMLDLRNVGATDLDELRNIVLKFLELRPSGSSYRSIIIAGSSARKTVSEIPKDGVGVVPRNELQLWSRLQQIVPANVSLVFGDYGIIHPDFSGQGPNKYMNAKIRYTDRGRIIYFRGHGLHYPVKDYDQYYQLARQVRDSLHYHGRDFSYGDSYIDQVASHNGKPGSPGTWVLADMNQHLEYTASRMPILLKRIHESQVDVEFDDLVEFT